MATAIVGNDTEKSDKKINAMARKTYSLVRNIFSSDSQSEQSLGENVNVFKSQPKMKPLVITERFYFNRREQAADETVEQYVKEITRLATHCEFNAHLDDALRDRLVAGLRNEGTQWKLIMEPDLTFSKAVSIAQSIEAASVNERKVQHPGKSMESFEKDLDQTEFQAKPNLIEDRKDTEIEPRDT